MTWFRVDDDLPFHRKVVKAGNAAMGLWVRAGAWSSQQLTDGFVPDDMIALMGTPAQRSKLIASRLWVEVDGGCQFHEWNETGRQPTSRSVREKRAEAAKRQQKYRDSFSGTAQVSDTRNATRNASVTDAVTPVLTPPPTRPVPKEVPTTSIDDADASPETGSVAAGIDAEFEEFWALWPRKIAKADAKKKYQAARNRGATAEQIRDGAKRQIDAWQAERKERRFIPHATTWLNQDRYDDEIERPKFRVINNPESAWDGVRVSGGSGWAPDTGWAQ